MRHISPVLDVALMDQSRNDHGKVPRRNKSSLLAALSAQRALLDRLTPEEGGLAITAGLAIVNTGLANGLLSKSEAAIWSRRMQTNIGADLDEVRVSNRPTPTPAQLLAPSGSFVRLRVCNGPQLGPYEFLAVEEYSTFFVLRWIRHNHVRRRLEEMDFVAHTSNGANYEPLLASFAYVGDTLDRGETTFVPALATTDGELTLTSARRRSTIRLH
jgi:hypothetical protein